MSPLRLYLLIGIESCPLPGAIRLHSSIKKRVELYCLADLPNANIILYIMLRLHFIFCIIWRTSGQYMDIYMDKSKVKIKKEKKILNSKRAWWSNIQACSIY